MFVKICGSYIATSTVFKVTVNPVIVNMAVDPSLLDVTLWVIDPTVTTPLQYGVTKDADKLQYQLAKLAHGSFADFDF